MVVKVSKVDISRLRPNDLAVLSEELICGSNGTLEVVCNGAKEFILLRSVLKCFGNYDCYNVRKTYLDVKSKMPDAIRFDTDLPYSILDDGFQGDPQPLYVESKDILLIADQLIDHEGFVEVICKDELSDLTRVLLRNILKRFGPQYEIIDEYNAEDEFAGSIAFLTNLPFDELAELSYYSEIPVKYLIENGEGIIPEGSTSVVRHGFAIDTEEGVEDNPDLKIVKIPGSVRDIGDCAFCQCIELKEIVIPEGVTRIGDSSFFGCSNIKRIYIPSTVTLIEETAFGSCGSLIEIVVSEDNPVYDSRNNCNAIIESVSNTLICGCGGTVIPDTVTSIGSRAFFGAESLSAIKVPSSVTEIGEAAFELCDNLINVELPDSITCIKNSTFSFCESLTKIRIPDCVTTIEESSFYACRSLITVDFGKAVDRINFGAFRKCSSLVEIRFPDSLTTIENSVFEGCTSLTEIYLPASLVDIARNILSKESDIPCVFLDCSKISKITVAEGNHMYDSRSNCNAVIETATNKLLFGCRNTIIPEDVAIIGDYAFACIHGMSLLLIPESVTEIEEFAFFGNKDLTELHIPASVTKIGENAFSECKSLKKIVIPDSVEVIGDYAFSDCENLTDVIIGKSVRDIGHDPFFGCTKLKNVSLPEGLDILHTGAEIHFCNPDEDMENDLPF